MRPSNHRGRPVAAADGAPLRWRHARDGSASPRRSRAQGKPVRPAGAEPPILTGMPDETSTTRARGGGRRTQGRRSQGQRSEGQRSEGQRSGGQRRAEPTPEQRRGPSGGAGSHPAPHHLPGAPARRRATRRHRGGDPRPPGRRHRRRDRLGQDDPDPEDLPRARPGPRRGHRPHPAAAHRGTGRRRAALGGARRRARDRCRLPGALHRPEQPRHARQGDDRRHPARRDAARP